MWDFNLRLSDCQICNFSLQLHLCSTQDFQAVFLNLFTSATLFEVSIDSFYPENLTQKYYAAKLWFIGEFFSPVAEPKLRACSLANDTYGANESIIESVLGRSIYLGGSILLHPSRQISVVPHLWCVAAVPDLWPKIYFAGDPVVKTAFKQLVT